MSLPPVVCSVCDTPILTRNPTCCSRCECVFYCSKTCQEKHWPAHRRACSADPHTLVIRQLHRDFNMYVRASFYMLLSFYFHTRIRNNVVGGVYITWDHWIAVKECVARNAKLQSPKFMFVPIDNMADVLNISPKTVEQRRARLLKPDVFCVGILNNTGELHASLYNARDMDPQNYPYGDYNDNE